MLEPSARHLGPPRSTALASLKLALYTPTVGIPEIDGSEILWFEMVGWMPNKEPIQSHFALTANASHHKAFPPNHKYTK